MTGGQIAALIVAILLLLPGGCYLLFGIGIALEEPSLEGAGYVLLIATAILGSSAFLFWVAFRGGRPAAPPSGEEGR